MRIAVFADVHGNLLALEAVLADIASRSPDVTLNLGDCLSGPLQAAATADLLMSRDFLTIRGNHDRQLLDRPFERMGPADQAAYSEIDDSHRRTRATRFSMDPERAGVLNLSQSSTTGIPQLLSPRSREVRGRMQSLPDTHRFPDAAARGRRYRKPRRK